jgi:hypothetical protein
MLVYHVVMKEEWSHRCDVNGKVVRRVLSRADPESQLYTYLDATEILNNADQNNISSCLPTA